MEVQSSTNLTLEKAAEVLAAELLAGAELRAFNKQANTLGDIGGTVSKAWGGLQPWQQGLLLGSGGGALVGGLSSLGRRREERQPVQSALTGAVAGGLLGGGLGAAGQYGPDWFRDGVASIYDQGKNFVNDLTNNRQADNSAAALTPEQVSQMTPNQIRGITPQQLQSGNLDLLNAVEARQNELVQQAGRDAQGSGIAAGGTALTTAGILGNEALRRRYRLNNGLLGPSDVARAMGVKQGPLGTTNSETLYKLIDEIGMTVPEAERAARQVVADQKATPPSAREFARRFKQKATAPFVRGGFEPGKRMRQAGRWFELPQWLESPKTRPLPPEYTSVREPAGETVVETTDKDTGTRTRRTQKNYQDTPSPTVSKNERARRLLETGRAARLGQGSPIGRGARYAGAMALPLILQWWANRNASAEAQQAMTDQLGINE